MGGVGSGNWYRFDKKPPPASVKRGRTLPHREGLAEAGALVHLALVAGRTRDGLIRGSVEGSDRPERILSSTATGAVRAASGKTYRAHIP